MTALGRASRGGKHCAFAGRVERQEPGLVLVNYQVRAAGLAAL